MKNEDTKGSLDPIAITACVVCVVAGFSVFNALLSALFSLGVVYIIPDIEYKESVVGLFRAFWLLEGRPCFFPVLPILC